MEGLLWLLMVAGMFYLMMRFGCAAHMVHGHGRGGECNGLTAYLISLGGRKSR